MKLLTNTKSAYTLIFLILMFLTPNFKSLAGTHSHKENEDIEAESVVLPDIPEDIRNPHDRADYLVLHFWDKMDFNDTVKSLCPSFMEQSFANFLSVFPYVSSENIIIDGFSGLIEKSGVNPEVSNFVGSIVETYLYDYSSPMRSEEWFLHYLEAELKSDHLSEVQKIRIEDKIKTLSKNKVGTPAADFNFTMPNGSQSSLYESLPGEGAELMLIFFDPDCDNCDETINTLLSDPAFVGAVENDSLRVVAIYNGENEVSWRRKASLLPQKWIVGINRDEIEENELYDLPLMPTIYVIDSRGIVKEKEKQVKH